MRKNEGGFSLVEALVAGGILSAIGLGMTTVIVNMNNSTRGAGISVSKTALAQELQRYASSAAALTQSQPIGGNGIFACCTGAGGCAGPNVCVHNVQNDFTLTDTLGNVVAGTTAVPIYYDSHGAKCTTPGGNCVIQATSSFVPSCPSGACGAGQASSVTVYTKVSMIPGVALGAGATPFPPMTNAVLNLIPLNLSGGTQYHIVKWLSGALADSAIVEDATGNVTVPNTTTIAGTNVISGGGITTPAVTYTSDGRLKQEIRPMTSTLGKIASINPVTFRWNNEARMRGLNDEDLHLGVIAQDVEKSFPQAVHTSKDGVKSVDYAVLVAPLIGAVRELKDDVDRLRAENKALRAKLEKGK